MIYQLYRAADRRDNTEALWLLRAPSGAHQMEEMAYLGKVPRPKDIGRHVSHIKRTTFAKPDFYVFESMYGWVMHCDHKTRHLIDQWENMVCL